MGKGQKQQSKEPTKKQLAFSRRERESRNKVLIGVGIVLVVVLGIALAGLYDQLIAKPSRPVAVVNDALIRTDDYQDRVRYQRFLLDTRLQNLQTQLTLMNPEEAGNEFLIQYYGQIAEQTQQQRLVVDQQTVDDMVEEELARQEAAEERLSVSEDEVDEAIRAGIAAMSGFLTETQATAVASTAVAATATAETFTATPEPTSTQSLTVTLVTTATPTATPEIPTPAPTPTFHIITGEEFSQNYARFLDILKEQTGLSEAKYHQLIKAGLLLDKVRGHFADQVPTDAEQVNVSHIQTDTQDEAQAAVERLDAGEEFALVASEVSTDTFTAANGGQLGWVLEGDLTSRYGPELEAAAFSLSPGDYSQPISSTFGFHVIIVNERSLRPLDGFRLQAQQQQAYFEWLEEARNAEGVENLWLPEMAPPDPLLERASGLPSGGIPPSHQ
jgi:parvulin-like peptidyl-prolyl isomerase